MVNIVKIFLLTIILLILGLATGFDLLSRIGYILVGLTVISFAWSWSSVRSLTLERDSRNRRAQVGQIVEERFTLTSNSLVPKLWVEILDYSTLPNHLASQVVSLGSKGTKSWQARTVCLRRGKYTLGPLTLKSGDALGLFRFRRFLNDKRTLLVYPETVPLPELNVRVGILSGGNTMQHRVQYITPNVSGVREYVPGDSFNRIHWPSTARHQHLMVKEFELDPFSDMWILLDMEARHHLGTGEESTEECAVKVAASLAKRFLDQNRSVGLATYGPHRQIITPDRGTRQVWKILEELAIAKSTGRVPLVELMTGKTTSFSRSTTLVIITPSPQEDWINALRDIMRSGLKAVAVVIDQSSFGGQSDSTKIMSRLTSESIPNFLVRNGSTLDQVFTGDGTARVITPEIHGQAPTNERPSSKSYALS